MSVSVVAGDWLQLRLTIKDGAAAQNLTGCTVWFDVRQLSASSSPALIALSTGSGLTILDAAAGTVALDGGAIALVPGPYTYSVSVQHSSWVAPLTATKGLFTVTQELNARTL